MINERTCARKGDYEILDTTLIKQAGQSRFFESLLGRHVVAILRGRFSQNHLDTSSIIRSRYIKGKSRNLSRLDTLVEALARCHNYCSRCLKALQFLYT